METKSKMFTVITFNDTRTILMFVQLTLGQLQEVLPKYVVRILTNEQRHLLPLDGKYGKYTFCDMTIGSSKGLVVEIDLKRFSKLCPSDTFRVFTKTCETITNTECIGLNPTYTDTINSVKRGKPRLWKVIRNSNGGEKKNEPNYVVPMIQKDYSLIYHPGNRFYNSERFSRLCA
jgi:hypothetical protein